MNIDLLSESTLHAFATPAITCPLCFSGSSEMISLVEGKSIWSKIKCTSCGEDFEIAKAIDELFASNGRSCYSLWANGSQIAKQAICEPGKTTLIDVKGIFEEIYAINHGFMGQAKYLAGGLNTHFIPQGYIMVSIAPNTNGEIYPIHVVLDIEGRKHSEPKLAPWQQMLLRAKLNLFSAPELTVIMALSAVDLYIESITNSELKPVEKKGRPELWSHYINEKLNLRLRKILGKRDFLLTEKFVQTRNALAHSGKYLERLPENIRQKEEEWLENGKHREGTGNFSPCGHFALRSALKIIRNCRRITENLQSEKQG